MIEVEIAMEMEVEVEELKTKIGDGDVGLDSDVAFSDGEIASRDAKIRSLDL